MSGVTIRNIEIAYGDVVAVDDVSVTIEPGEVHVLLGHSGSGKTTILRALAGFERARKGSIEIGEQVVDDGTKSVPPEERPVGLVFQDYALFPHMTVAKNIAFGVRGDATTEVSRLLELIGLSSRADATPGELSGGEQQRVALARALARRPELLLMDEPFSNLDPELRSDVRRQTFDLVREMGISTLLVTHTAEEAMEVGDRISVIQKGKLLQTGAARELYERPATVAVARALGPANVLPAEVVDGEVRGVFGTLGADVVSGLGDKDAGLLVVRPEDVVCAADGDFDVELAARTFLGDRIVRRVRAGDLLLESTCAPWAASETIRSARIRRAHLAFGSLEHP